MTTNGRFEKVCQFFKVENGVAYGFAIVCTDKGAPYWDLQDDHIPEDEMVTASLDFMKSTRVGSDQHTGEHVGDIVFGFPVTKANATSLGIASEKTGFLIGYQPQDPVHLDMIANGERTGFSIGGFLLDYDGGEIGKGVWSSSYQEALPDSAFLLVKGKGKSKTRAYPVKDAMGKVDGPHVESALKRVPMDKNLDDKTRDSLLAKANELKGELQKMAKNSPDPGDVYVPNEIDSQGSAPKKKKGKIYRRFKIDEISLVTKPAMEGATVGFVKSATIAKSDADRVFTSSEDGHQHVVYVDDVMSDYASTGCAITSGTSGRLGEWHSHQIIVEKDGSITLADNAGHGHTCDVKVDPATVDNMDVNTPPTGAPVDIAAPAQLMLSAPPPARKLTPPIEPASLLNKSHAIPEQMTMKTEAEIAALEKSNERLSKMVELNDAQRAYAKSLSTTEADSFISKSSTERSEIVKGAVECEVDGVVYFKHDDQRLIAMAKQADSMKKSLVMEQSLRKSAEIAKAAAEDMGNYSEDDKTHAAVMAAVESIADEGVRKSARTMLKAGNAAIAKLSKSTGTGGQNAKIIKDGETSPMKKAADTLKTAVEAYGKAHNITNYQAAFAEATQVDQATRDAYDEVANLRRQGITDDE